MIINTIGFTKTSAKDFFGRLEKAKVKRVIDVRLKLDSQLSGFAKGKDLPFFLERVCGISYVHEPLLAPTEDMLRAYKKGNMDWNTYEAKYLNLLSTRGIESRLDSGVYDHSCLLCSEHKPHQCHRRLAAEFLSKAWGKDVKIVHL